jgi:stage V sporulation protein R
VGDSIPSYPEKDLLWFFAQYAPIEPWERDILEIIREESHYFYP